MNKIEAERKRRGIVRGQDKEIRKRYKSKKKKKERNIAKEKEKSRKEKR
jgi:hypothetical protein